MNIIKLTILLLSLIFMMKCEKGGDDITGTVTETENKGLIRGRILNNDGTPAKGIKIRFVAVDHDPGSGYQISLDAADSCYTNQYGYYGINSVDTGTWNILAADSGNKSKLFNDSLIFTGETLKVQTDSLAIAGSLRGSIRLQRGDDPRITAVHIIGALAYANVDQNGVFVFPSLAKGHYHLRFRTYDSKYEILDTAFYVAAGIENVIDSPIVIPLKIPTPTGFHATYDTMKQIVTLRWDAMNPLKVSGYNVYRQRTDTSAIPLNSLPLRGNVFLDTTASQDMRYVYRVASVDSQDNEGPVKAVWKDTILIKPAYDLVTKFGGSGNGNGKFTEISHLQRLNDGRLLVIDYGGHRAQIFNDSGIFLSSIGSFGEGAGQFNYPVSATEDDSGNIYILEALGSGRIQKFNKNGIYHKSWALGTYRTGIVYHENRIFVVCQLNTFIEVLDLLTDKLTTKPIPENLPIVRIAYNGYDNNLVMTCPRTNNVIITDTNSNLIRKWGGSGIANGLFSNIGAVSTSLTENNIYVNDRENFRVQIFDTAGAFKGKISVFDPSVCVLSQCPEGQLQSIYASNDGKTIFIADRYYIRKYKAR